MIFLSVPDPYSLVKTGDLFEWDAYDSLGAALRVSEYTAVVERCYFEGKKIDMVAVYSTRVYAIYEAWISLARTTFICILLALAALYFTSDANTLVLNPIDRMLEKVKLIASNPLAAANDEVNQAGIMTMMYNKEQREHKDTQQA